MKATDLVGPDGRRYVLENEDPAALQQALAKGFRLSTPEDDRTLGEKATSLTSQALDVGTAVGAGLERGASAGLTDVAAAMESPEAAAQLAGAKKTHPYISGASGLAGALASPVSEVAAPLEALAPAGIVGRIGAKALGGAAVGSLFGAGATLSDAALGDHDLTAEQLVAGTGLGALLGLAGGGLGGAVDEAASAFVPKLQKALNGADESLKEFADNRWLKAGGGIQSDIKRIPPARRPAVADVFREHVPPSGDLGETFEGLKASRDEAGDRIGKLVQATDKLTAKTPGAGPKLDPNTYLAGLNPLEAPAIAKDVADLASAMQSNELRGGGYKGAHDILHTLGERANWKFAPDSDPVRNRLLKQLYRESRADFEAQLAPHLGSDLSKEFLGVNQRYSALSDALTLARHGMERAEGNRFISASDYLAGIGGGMLHGGPMGLLTGLGSAVAHKVLRERGASVAARLADRISESQVLSSIATSFGKQLPAKAPLLGTYAPVLLSALQHSPASALATHMVMGQADPGYQAAAQQAGFTPETPAQHRAALERAHGMAQVAGAAQSTVESVRRGLEQVLRGAAEPKASGKTLNTQDFGAKRMRRESADGHEQRVQEVRNLASDEGALLERVTKNVGRLSDIAPGVAGALARTAQTAVQYLAQESATPPPAGPLAPKWIASEAERHAFVSVLETVEDPLSVLRHAAAGTLTPERMKAFQAVYPTLARAVADEMLQRVAEQPSRVPYRARLMVGLLTGTDPDGTMGPQAVAANQAAIQASRRSPAGVNPPSGTLKRPSPVTVAERTATPGQRRELQHDEA